jgi:hypothetical protein
MGKVKGSMSEETRQRIMKARKKAKEVQELSKVLDDGKDYAAEEKKQKEGNTWEK